MTWFVILWRCKNRGNRQNFILHFSVILQLKRRADMNIAIADDRAEDLQAAEAFAHKIMEGWQPAGIPADGFCLSELTLNEIKDRLGINKDGPAIALLTSTCAKRMDKYVPMRDGNLVKYKLTNHEIIYDQEYAAYQYYGQRQDGTHPINPANRDRSKHPLASS